MTESEIELYKTFAAQYIFQEVFVSSDTAEKPVRLNGYLFSFGPTASILAVGWLELKAIKDITDEDAKDICSQIGLVNAERFFIGENLISYTDDSYTVRFYFDGYATVCKHSIEEKILHHDTNRVMDILIEKSYAMYWRKFKISKQIELGWIKIKA